MKLIGYDTETWSSHQISEGLEHYFADPGFRILCAAWAWENGDHTNTVLDGHSLHPIGGAGEVYCAHNAHFDRSANERIYGKVDGILWFDTMVGVRAILGASLGRNSYVSLDKSAKLLLPKQYHKDAAGKNLMPLFSFPSPENNFGKIHWSNMIASHSSEWRMYVEYMKQDAVVAYQLAKLTQEFLGEEAFERLVYEAELTYRMNCAGWPVDTRMLQVMTDKAQENTDHSIEDLLELHNPGWSTTKKNGDEEFKPLNLNSGVQLKKWLAERDIDIDNAQSDTIDETIVHVEDNLDLRPDWAEVLAVLQAKVDRGGATLKKLNPIAKGLSKDGRLRHMYNHIAAASTHRTTGSGVQMQNLKRLPDDVEDLTEDSIAGMNNGDLARNIRQLFKAQDDGEIIVADLKSIEGLLVGWVFGVDWMVEAVRDGKDMYSMNAATRFRVPYESVLPPQRRKSKTGVLSGNYGGGWKAYMKSSPGMAEEEARAEVKAYRETVPNLVQSWWDLNDLIMEAVKEGDSALRLHNGYTVHAAMHSSEFPDLDEPTLEVAMFFRGRQIFSRLWHGVLIELDDDGREEVTYAVADERKTADVPWKRLTAKGEKFKLYGGKLTGTLIQSLARELYFFQLGILYSVPTESFTIIGQLHDEVVCEWSPKKKGTLEYAQSCVNAAMSNVPWFLDGCPVRVKVSSAPRYIK